MGYVAIKLTMAMPKGHAPPLTCSPACVLPEKLLGCDKSNAGEESPSSEFSFKTDCKLKSLHDLLIGYVVGPLSG